LKNEKVGKLSYAVFIATLTVVVINLVSVFFPALTGTLSSGSPGGVDPFESSAWAIPILVINLVFLGFGILYYTERLPNSIRNSIKFIRNFEVSRKVAIIVIVVLLGLYIGFTIEELSVYEGDMWKDYERVEKVIEYYPDPVRGSERLVNSFLLYSSHTVLQNIHVVPFIASISLLLLTYFFTVKISKKRFPGIVAMVVLMQSHTFLQYDTLATYTNFWVLFYLLSLYLIYKRWYLSPISFLLSIFSKSLTVIFLPVTFFFTYKIPIPRKKKIYIMITYVIVGALIVGKILLDMGSVESPYIKSTFDYANFWTGFSTMAFQMRFDGLIFVSLLPVTIALFLVSRKGISEADSMLVCILFTLLLSPILLGFTSYNMHPYRYLPFVVFFAVAVGTLLSKKLFVKIEP